MDEFLNFLKSYKEVLLSSLACLLTIVCMIVKRKPKTFDDFLMIVDEALLCVPSLVNKVERPGDGVAKKNQVISSVISLVSKKLGRSLDVSETDYVKIKAGLTIEDVLSTPTTKESIRIC